MRPVNVLSNIAYYLKHFLIRERDYRRCSPSVLTMFLTHRCTSKCQTCNMWTRRSHDPELTPAQWKTVVDHLGHKGRLSAEIFGGDALLRPDVLAPLIEYMKQQGIPYVDMPTNANLLDREMAEALVAAGLDRIYLSLDSVDEGQDEIRGVSDSFARISRAADHLRAARDGRENPKICINTTVSMLNYDHLEKVADAAVNLGADEVSFGYLGEFDAATLTASRINGAKPNPYFAPQEHSLRVNRQQAEILKAQLKRMKRRAATLPIYLRTKNMDTLRIDNLTSGRFPFRKCYVSHSYVSIDPYGNVSPCPFYPDFVLGNLVEQPLDAIWNNEKHREFMEIVDRRGLPMCHECIYNIERNPTFWQAIHQMYLVYTRKGLDEPPGR